MELRRRFIFRGNAAAIGGRIVRPTDVVIDSSTASSLTVAGGRSRSQAAADAVRRMSSASASAATSAEGVFDDVKQQVELSFGRVAEDALTMTTNVQRGRHGADRRRQAEADGEAPPRVADSKSPTASGEPAIGVGSDTAIEGAAIGGFGLIVTLAVPLFQRFDTQSKLLDRRRRSAVREEVGRPPAYEAGRSAVRPSPPTSRAGPELRHDLRHHRQSRSSGPAKPFPGATIDQHVVTVPGLRDDLLRRAPDHRLVAAADDGADRARLERAQAHDARHLARRRGRVRRSGEQREAGRTEASRE